VDSQGSGGEVILMTTIGVLGPKECGEKAMAAVAQWEAGLKRAAARRARPKPEGAAAAPKAAAPAVAPAAGKVVTPEERQRLTLELLTAACRGDSLRVKRLLNAGADLEARDIPGSTALMRASNIGGTSGKAMAKELIAAGADVNATDGFGSTALMWASRHGDEVIAKELIAHGADINAKDNAGWTALEGATSNGHKEVAKNLRAAGAKE